MKWSLRKKLKYLLQKIDWSAAKLDAKAFMIRANIEEDLQHTEYELIKAEQLNKFHKEFLEVCELNDEFEDYVTESLKLR